MDLERKAEDDFTDWVHDLPYPSIALKLQLMGLRGWPDRTVLAKGHLFFIEFKRTKDDPLRSQQVTWKRNLERLGFSVYVCWTLKQAKEAYRNEVK